MATIEDLDLFDARRGRRVPTRLWVPQEGPPWAWVLFSVGFGGGSTGYAYLARAWARSGLATAVIEHVGSNAEVLRSLDKTTLAERARAVVGRVKERSELEARPRDLQFVRAELSRRFDDLPLGVAGHSFGAYTALASLGLKPLVSVQPFAYPAQGITACLIVSPQPPGVLFSQEELTTVRCPTLVMTGTEDAMLDGSEDYRGRLKVYESIPAEYRNLVLLDRVSHMAFAGLGLGLAPTLEAIASLTTIWWKQTLVGEMAFKDRCAELQEAGIAMGVKGEFR